uniref:Transposase n=1 Tax=Bursaphelenchus xylophilus TaxID=6326 RepID=A0A1I7SEM6_BURXY
MIAVEFMLMCMETIGSIASRRSSRSRIRTRWSQSAIHFMGAVVASLLTLSKANGWTLSSLQTIPMPPVVTVFDATDFTDPVVVALCHNQRLPRLQSRLVAPAPSQELEPEVLGAAPAHEPKVGARLLIGHVLPLLVRMTKRTAI